MSAFTLPVGSYCMTGEIRGNPESRRELAGDQIALKFDLKRTEITSLRFFQTGWLWPAPK